MQLRDFIRENTTKLTRADINSARLDCLVLLCDELDRDKAWILAHDDFALSPDQQKRLEAGIARREKREPLSYIRGRQEFYGRTFAVGPDVLIPRPETEAFIELLPNKPNYSMIDVGTGSGAIAITAKLEHPTWDVTACDIDEEALLVAALNADALQATVVLRRSDLLQHINSTFNIIVANLPYVDRTWERSPETDFEPPQALFAEDGGLALIEKLISQAPTHLATDGWLLLEADPEQHPRIIELAQKQGLHHTQTLDYVITFQAVAY